MNLSMNIHNSTDLFALKTAMNLLRVGCQENSLGKMADREPIGLLSSQSLPLCYSSGRFPKRESCPVRGVWHLFEQLQLDTSLFSAMRNGWMQGIYARDVWSRSKGFLGHRQLLEEILE